MEDVLDVYTRPYDPKKRPQVCLDETSRQLLADAIDPEPMAPGRQGGARGLRVRKRGGVQPVLMLTEPLSGWRHVVLSERRTRLDFAHCIKESVDIHYYPEAEVIVLVMDNLNTHTRPPPSTTKPLRPRRPNASPTAWRSTTHPNTAVG